MKKILKLLSLALLVVAFAGCSSVKQYSVASYQGLLPLEDHRYVYGPIDADAGGI